MKIAVLADIHSNYIALDRCMEYAVGKGIDKFIFLGDYIGELAYPERTMERLYEYQERYDCTFIRGNKENYWIDCRASGQMKWREYDSTTGALWYAYHHLTDWDIDFFESLPISRQISYEGFPAFTICHGSPADVRESMVIDAENTRAILESSITSLIFCAHNHRQGKTLHKGKAAVNPGSVGLSLGGGAKSQFLILHGEETQGETGWREEFVSISYDREEALRQLKESGLTEHAPGWCKVTAHDIMHPEEEIGHARMLWQVMELCRTETGRCDWPDIPEKYWDLALKEFGL